MHSSRGPAFVSPHRRSAPFRFLPPYPPPRRPTPLLPVARARGRLRWRSRPRSPLDRARRGHTAPSSPYRRTHLVDPFSFPPIAALLQFVYSLVSALAAAVAPVAGPAAAAVAIVVLTLIVRTLLI